jgi:hypothetical protein
MHLSRLNRSECLTIEEMVNPFADPEQAAALAELGEESRRGVLAWLDALTPVICGPRAGRGRRLRAAAQQNAAKMDDIDCANLPQFAAWVKTIAENYGGNVQQAYRAILALWKTGGEIPGYSTRPLPGLNGHPRGWSYPNINRLANLTKYERAVSRVGRTAAKAFAPFVIHTRVGMECGRGYMRDDLWHDVALYLPGKMQKEFVRALELCVIDIFSSSKIASGYKPRFRDEVTGKRINLRGSDMRFLLAHLLCNIGFHPDGCVIFLEKGTASIDKELHPLITQRSNGRIRFVTGAIQDRPAILGYWGGDGKGNPRAKALLESLHRLPHSFLRWLPGQVGSNSRTDKVEDLAGRIEEWEWIIKVLEKKDESFVQRYCNNMNGPAIPYPQYIDFVSRMYDAIDCRTDHKLEGWEQAGLVISGFRPSVSSHDFFRYDALQNVSPEEAAAIRAILAANPSLHVSRKLSPREVWNDGRRRLIRLPQGTFAEICGRDLAVKRAVRNGMIRFSDADIECGRVFSYPAIAINQQGREEMLREGQSYLTVANPFDMSKLYILNENFGLIGTLTEQIVVSHVDMENIHRAMAQAAHAEAVNLMGYRSRHADKEGEAKRAIDHNRALLKQMAAEEAAPISVSAQVAALSDMLTVPEAAPEAPDNEMANLAAMFGNPI